MGEALIIKYVLRVSLVLVHAVVLTRDSSAVPFAPPVTLKLSVFAPGRLFGINAIIR